MKLPPESILYEDNHLFVLEKKPGLLSQADYSGDPDILNMAKDYIKIRDQKPGRVYLGLVHRLDRNTGGVICLAKTSKAASRLSEQIRKRQWEKRYLALSAARDQEEALKSVLQQEDNPQKAFPEFTLWRDVLSKDKKKNRVRPSKNGKEALSRQRLLAARSYKGEVLYLREFSLESGRSHQIRVQSALRGFPLLGDLKYQGRQLPGQDPHFLGLWACGLGIIHPVKKERMYFYSLPPEEGPWSLFSSVIKKACSASDPIA